MTGGSGLTLVTGANGFIGSAVVRSLEQSDCAVRRVCRRACRESDFAIEIGPATRWDEALSGVEQVIHLAGRLHDHQRRLSPQEEQEVRDINVAGTLGLARAAIAAGVERFVYVSSASIHGRSSRRVLSEADRPVPVGPYATSKHQAELALRGLGDDMGIVIIRPPLVYGPGASGNFSRLLRLVQRGIPLPFGSARGRRSFIYRENLVDAIVTCLDRIDRAAGETFLVSDGHDLTAAELVGSLARAIGRRARLVPVPEGVMRFGGRLVGMTDDVDRLFGAFQLDISKIRQTLLWEPPVPVADGLSRTVADHSDQGRLTP